MIKYAANSFLATKISFANTIAHLSEKTGADALKVLEGIGLDKRIGKQFLQPGPGYGGSCFPKDVKALIAIAKGYGYEYKLLHEVENVNLESKKLIVKKAEDMLGDLKGKKIGVLGLAFKPNTDDMRFAPSIEIIKWLQEQGAEIAGYDPESMEKAKKVISGMTYMDNMYDVCRDADLVLVLTDWNEFKEIDLKKVEKLVRKKNLIDARNIYDPELVKGMGFNYIGVGRV
jgi:UDPglucose 6-dehydrogenase